MTEHTNGFPEAWICTNQGYQVDLCHPKPSTINLSDIVFALAKAQRWAGQTDWNYTVAVHSLLCLDMSFGMEDPERAPAFALDVLSHDMTEAYLVDIPSPLKDVLDDYRTIEKRLDSAIRQYQGLSPVLQHKEALKWIDNRALLTEARDLFTIPRDPKFFGLVSWDGLTEGSIFETLARVFGVVTPLGERLTNDRDWEVSDRVEEVFLKAYNKLHGYKKAQEEKGTPVGNPRQGKEDRREVARGFWSSIQT